MSGIDIEIRHAVHPDQAETFGTDELRKHFLISDLFRPRQVKAVYTHYDRMVVLGISPTASPIALGADLADLVKSPQFLSRREIAIFNVGGAGRVIADRAVYNLQRCDALYLPMGVAAIAFESVSESNPAKFYATSAPAHVAHPPRRFVASELQGDSLGATDKANRRVLTKYMHAETHPTCQLVTGLTRLEEGNVWNTMPPHTHDRRMEAYLYFDLPEQHAIIHMMGRPQATRHIIVRNEEAVLSPPWSIHAGCGTSAYAFIWAMAGDNQTFADMDAAPVAALA